MALVGEPGNVAGDLFSDGGGDDAARPPGEVITRLARPPISAERMVLASATTAAGSEIVDYLLLAHVLLGELGADLFGEAQEHFAADFDG